MKVLPNEATQPLWRLAIQIAMIATAIMVFIGPLLQMVQAFGIPITDDQVTTIVAFVQSLTGIGAPLAVAAGTVPKVTPWNPIDGAKTPVGDQTVVGPQAEG